MIDPERKLSLCDNMSSVITANTNKWLLSSSIICNLSGIQIFDSLQKNPTHETIHCFKRKSDLKL